MKKKSELAIVDKFILYYFIFQIFFLRWYNGNSYISYISLLLMLRVIIIIINNVKIKPLDVFWCASYLLIVCINILVNGKQRLLRSNGFAQGIANLSVIIFIFILSERYRDGLKNFALRDIFTIFNIYFLFNVPIIYKQLDYTYFLMRGIGNNPMYEDHITGLIGQSGTHQLTFYWILLTIINLYKYATSKKKYILVIIISEIVFMIMVSSRNDNTAFFLIFPIIVGQYLALNLFKKEKNILKLVKNIFKALIIGCFVFVGVKYLYTVNEDVNEFVNNRVLEKLEQFSIVNKGNRQTDTSEDEERIYLFKVALEDGKGYKMGHGIGSIESYGDISMPVHFGMSEISLRVYEGGIIYLAILILIFSHFLNRIVASSNKFGFFANFAIICGNITFMTIYTTIFREPFYSFALSFIFFIFSERYIDVKKENGRL